jgi:hypothetical protein
VYVVPKVPKGAFLSLLRNFMKRIPHILIVIAATALNTVNILARGLLIGGLLKVIFTPVWSHIGSAVTAFISGHTAFLSLVLGIATLFLFVTIVKLLARYLRSLALFARRPSLIDYAFGIVLALLYFDSFGAAYQALRAHSFAFVLILLVLIALVNLGTFFLRRAELKERAILSVQDRLGVGGFVEKLYTEITSLKLSGSFVISLLGGWGEGKTSVLNLLSYKLGKNKAYLVIKFEPWYYRDEEALLNAFLGAIETGLKQRYYIAGLGTYFAKYRQLVSTGINSKIFKMEVRPASESIDEVKRRIERDIISTGKILVIIIDDIDRLMEGEIYLLLKLVRLNGRFKNTVFLLAYDPAILRGLKGVNERYMEKIVQKPLALPAISRTSLDSFFIDELNRIVEAQGVAQELNEVWNDYTYLYLSNLRNLFSNMRNIKRYLNAVEFTLPSMRNEVSLMDFLIFEMVRVFYPAVYDDIKASPWIYIPQDWDRNRSFGFGYNYDEGNKYVRIKKHIEALLDTQSNGQIALDLLSEVFVEVKNAFAPSPSGHMAQSKYLRDKRLTHPEIFERYMRQEVPEDQLSDSQFEGILMDWKDLAGADRKARMSQYLSDVIKAGKAKILFHKIALFADSIDSDVATDLIIELAKVSDRVSTTGELWDTEFHEASRSIARLLDTSVERASATDVMKSVVDSSPRIYFAIDVVNWFTKEDTSQLDGVRNYLDVDGLKKQVVKRIKDEIVTPRKDVLGTDWESRTQSSTMNNYVKNLTTDHPARIVDLIKLHVQQTRNLGKVESTWDKGYILRLYRLPTLKTAIKAYIALPGDEINVQLLRAFLAYMEAT